ncbi:MAG: alkaline phosphatase family protein [Pyrinomonadaceae bacterium]
MSNNGKKISGGAGVTRPRRLLLCLDGVPFDLVRAAKERGLFDGFGEPSRLLSPFPTLTNVALSEMLGASAPNGYESLYFDRKTREMRGGISKYIGRRTPDKIPSSYMDELDYQEPLPFEFLIYVAPEAVWRADMRRFHEKFRNAPQTRDFFAFLKGTDGLLHIRGPERLSVALESLDKILKEIQKCCGAETEIVLFSDHGMNLQENKRVHLQTHLNRRGYKFTDRLNGLKNDKSIAVPAFGLCGYAALYCAGEEAAVKVAAELTSLEGLDFSIHRAGERSVMVQGGRGVARIDMRQNGHGLAYRYEQTTGDPLQLAPFVKALMEDEELDNAGYASDAAWYARTANHIYPDALSNLFNSLNTPRVRHNADVLVSMQDGYYYGASLFSRFVRIAATHGNALRASTSAFLMSTHRALPETVRAGEAQPLLR